MGEQFISISSALGYDIQCGVDAIAAMVPLPGVDKSLKYRTKNMSPSDYFKQNARLYNDKSNTFTLSGTERRDLLMRSSSLHMRYTFPGSRDNLKGLFKFNKNGQMTELNANTPCNKDASKDYWDSLIRSKFPAENECLSEKSMKHPCKHLLSSNVLKVIAAEHAKYFKPRLQPVKYFFSNILEMFPNLQIYVQPNVIIPCGWNLETYGTSWVRRDIQELFLMEVNKDWETLCADTQLCSYIDINTAELRCSDGEQDGIHFLYKPNCQNKPSLSLTLITSQILKHLEDSWCQ
ncbi:unnamed protein product [Bathycoccus prasinos]